MDTLFNVLKNTKLTTTKGYLFELLCLEILKQKYTTYEFLIISLKW